MKEIENFNNYLDKDGDGFMNEKEVIEWIRPDGNTPIDLEVGNIVRQTDANKDGKLSKREVLENYQHFFKSQATEWGQQLLHHDEF